MTYKAAREKTIQNIRNAFWNLYNQSKPNKITVNRICEIAHIHRSTFYFYFETIDDVLTDIKNNQMKQLKELFDNTLQGTRNFQVFIPSFQKLFLENQDVLIPLVVQYKDPAFARTYREVLEDEMIRDLEITYGKETIRNHNVVKITVIGLVDMFLLSLADPGFSLEDASHLSNGMINVGLKNELRDFFDIHIGFVSMAPKNNI